MLEEFSYTAPDANDGLERLATFTAWSFTIIGEGLAAVIDTPNKIVKDNQTKWARNTLKFLIDY